MDWGSRQTSAATPWPTPQTHLVLRKSSQRSHIQFPSPRSPSEIRVSHSVHSLERTAAARCLWTTVRGAGGPVCSAACAHAARLAHRCAAGLTVHHGCVRTHARMQRAVLRVCCGAGAERLQGGQHKCAGAPWQGSWWPWMACLCVMLCVCPSKDTHASWVNQLVLMAACCCSL